MDKTIRRAIGARLQEARTSQKLSQDYVAEKLGLNRQAVSKWECGVTMPRADEWYHIGKIYGVSLDYLVYGIRTVPVSGSSLMETIFAKPGIEPPALGEKVL
jgi:transcriptional regulator with XRE-family HTH domain